MRNLIDIINETFSQELNDGVDTVEMTVPLLLRCLEWAKEEARTDVELHKFTENVVSLDRLLNIDDYETLLKGI